MTRTHVDEYELVELQRKASSVFARINSIAEYMWNWEEKFSENTLENVETACDLCREVSDAVDALTEYVRHQKEAEADRKAERQMSEWEANI